MSLSSLARSVPSHAVWVATHPVQSTSRVVGFAKGVVVSGVGLAEVLKGTSTDGWPDASPADAPARPGSTTEPRPAPSVPVEPDEPTGEYVPPAPTHAPPAQPPVDVVEQALAAEAAAEPGDLAGGMQGEPHPVTREEVHEGAPFTRAERDEIDEETEEGLAGDGAVDDPR